MNKVFAGCASLAIISMIASPTFGFGITAPEGYSIKTSFSAEATSPSKEDVLSVPTLSESQKQKIKAIYAGYDAKWAVLENSRPLRPRPVKEETIKQRQDLETNTCAKIRTLLTAKELDLLINPFGIESLRKKEAGVFPVPSKILLVRLPDLEAQKKAQLEALLVDYQNRSKQFDTELQKQFAGYSKLLQAYGPKEVEFNRHANELSENAWKEVKAILQPEQIKVLRTDEGDSFIPAKQQLLGLKTLTDAQKERLQAIFREYEPQSSKLHDSWETAFRSEWNDIKGKLTAQQLQGMPAVGSKSPWIFWVDNRDRSSGKAGEAKYELKISPKTEHPKVGAQTESYVVSYVDDKQEEQIKGVIEEYRIRFAGLQRQSHELGKVEWAKIKPILTKEQLTSLAPARLNDVYRKQIRVHTQERAKQ